MTFESTETAESLNKSDGGFLSQVRGTFVIGDQKFRANLKFNVDNINDEGIRFSGNMIIKNPESKIGDAAEVSIYVKGKQ
jgi:hypothetical protein